MFWFNWVLPVIPERNHSFNMCATFSKKLTFLTPWYAHVRVRIRRLEMLILRKIYHLSVCIIDLVLVILVLFRLDLCIVKPKVFKFLSLKFLYVYINSNAWKSMITFDINDLAQPAFTCSKLSTETQGQGVKYVQS